MSSDLTISGAAIGMMALAALFGLTAPLALGWYLHRRTGGRWRFFFLGCGIFLLFALVLEQGVHALVLGSAMGGTIRKNIWLYALYGGLMAGLFEECGRWLAFRLTWKKLRGPEDALLYGAGHGGIEAMVLLGVNMIGNIVMALALNRGGPAALEAMFGLNSEAGMSALTVLSATPVWMYLWSIVERCSAICLHISLSVLVCTAVTRRGAWYWFPIAIGIHALADLITVVAAAYLSVAGTELLVAAAAAGAALIARKLYLREMKEKA